VRKLSLQKWGGLASFLLVAAFIVARLIYLTGNLRSALGPFAYSLADLLSGPVWAACFVTAFIALQERIGKRASQSQPLALGAVLLAAGAMVLVASIRAANRHYHLVHPELHLDDSTTVLVVWATLVAGVTAAAWHFLGWALALVASAGWISGLLPRGLCILYWFASLASLFVFMFPDLEGAAGALSLAWAIWQGVYLWKAAPGEKPADEEAAQALLE
jgi:hypothetical protein